MQTENNHGWQAIIFDFDGVIVDSEPIHYQAFQECLKPFGISHTYDQYVERYIGFDDRDGFAQMFQDAGKELHRDLLDRLIREKFQSFRRIVARGIQAFPGVVELIEDLGRQPLALAIASGSYRVEIEMMLDALGLRHHFPIIVTADDVAKSKPDPETYLIAYRELQRMRPARIRSPRQCLVVEDTPTGIAAARKAGLPVLAVAHSYAPDRLQDADMLVTNLVGLHLGRIRCRGCEAN